MSSPAGVLDDLAVVVGTATLYALPSALNIEYLRDDARLEVGVPNRAHGAPASERVGYFRGSYFSSTMPLSKCSELASCSSVSAGLPGGNNGTPAPSMTGIT